MSGSKSDIAIKVLSRRARRGFVVHGGFRAPCAIGRSGIVARKREGDGASPLGTFRMVQVMYRPDQVSRPRTQLPVAAMRPNDGWCDAPSDRNYNRSVRLPYPASSERLWRKDRLYDIVVVLDHNQRPRVRYHGSAIFVHVARASYQPTEGCIALALADLQRLLRRMRPANRIRIG